MIIFCGLITMATSDPAPAIDESRVVLGDLPDDFLRIMVEVPVPATEGVPPSLLSNGPTQGMLQVTIIEARLAKNYGMMKMDPFVRIITGNFCKRTAICQKGSISPRWNQTVEVPVLPHFQTVTIEVVDFRTLGDRTIATGQLPLSQFIEGNVVEDWFPLSGKQGKDKEGVINLRFQFVRTAAPPVPIVYAVPGHNGQVLIQQPPMAHYPYQQQAPPQAHRQPQYQQHHPSGQQQQRPTRPPPQPQTRPTSHRPSPEQVQQLQEMFPVLEQDIIESVLQANHGDVERSLTALLQLTES
eukprot:TRINITY_DN11742_c0_g2_i2.p2 TRINITY_DN11742_c0_g2~~TRINITY_DN11742_c0_g2_i2.p2  ORF type:complete len:298 (+),score=46.73 TRINITY_DN11742_c0_g2_i2:1288-2181(+)